jgi:hypothetical protein
MSPLDRVRIRHAELLELKPATAIAPGIDLAIYHIDAFMRLPGLPEAIKQKASVARSSLRAILKLL